MSRTAVVVGCVLVLAATRSATPQVSIGTQVLTAPGGQPGDACGRSVAVSGGTILVGAPGDDERGENAGAAHVFVRDASGTWRLQQKLLPHEVRDGDFFGWSVALDGDFAVVGAPGDDRNTSGAPDAASADRGAVYAFRCIGDSWQAAKRLQPPGVAAGGAFGASVAIGRGHVLVGAIYGKRVANKWGGLISCGGVWQFEDESGGSGGIKALVSGPAGSLLVIDGNALIKVDRTGHAWSSRGTSSWRSTATVWARRRAFRPHRPRPGRRPRVRRRRAHDQGRRPRDAFGHHGRRQAKLLRPCRWRRHVGRVGATGGTHPSGGRGPARE